MKSVLPLEMLQRGDLLDVIPIAVYACAADGTIRHFNRRAAALWGRTPRLEDADHRFCGAYRLYRPDGTPLPRAESPVAVALRTGVPVSSQEVVIERPDGSRVIVEMHAEPLCDDDGQQVGACGCFQEVTARSGAVSALWESQERLQAALNAADTGTFRWEIRTGAVHCDASLLRLLGREGHAPVLDLAAALEIVHPEDRERFSAAIRRCAEEGVDFSEEYRVVCPDGRVRWLSDKGRTIFDGSGQPLYMTGACLDITERKRAEEALHHQSIITRTITENATAALFMIDTAGRCTYMNQAAESMTGYRLEELQEMPLHDAIHHSRPDGSRYPKSECPIDRALPEKNQVRRHEDRFIRKDGSFFPVLVSAEPILRDGVPFGTVVEVREISAEKQAEAALRQSEAQFRQLADAMPQMVWASRPDGQLDYYNRRWYEFTGFPEGMVGDQSWEPVLHPEDRRPTLDRWYTAVRTGEPYEMEYRFWDRRRGTYRWYLGRALPVRDESGRIVRWFGTCTDIDDQKRTEERLREETQAVETINSVGQMLAAELVLDRLLQALTDAATTLCGAQFGAFFYNAIDERGEVYSLYTLSGAPREAFEKFPMPRNTAIFGPTFKGEGMVRCDDVTVDARYGRNPPYHGLPEGHLPVRSYLAAPVIARSGEVLGGLFFGHPEAGVFSEREERIIAGVAAQAAVAIDNARLYGQATTEIRERRRAQSLLDGQKHVLEGIARGAPLEEVLSAICGLVEGDADEALCSVLLRDGDGRLRHGAAPGLPEAYLRSIDGLSIGPCAGTCGTAAYARRCVVTTDIATDPLWANFRSTALAHGLRACWSNPIFSSTGEVLGCVAMYYREPRGPSEADRQLSEMATHLAGIAIERSRAEEALRRRAEELARADRQKDEFLAMLGHELRNPLTPILNAIQVLQSRDSDDPLVRRQREVIERQARQMGRLLDDLLDVARITRGKIPLRKQALDLAAVTTQAAESVRSLAEERSHSLTVSVPPEPVYVDADATRIHQVIYNLLNNAVKYTEPGGTLRLELTSADGAAVIRVADNGAGIPKEHLASIFGLFIQGDRSLTRTESGLGVGLTMVRQLVELHGGSVEARSEGPGCGSEFVVHLPLVEAPVLAPGQPGERAVAESSPGPRRVLIVDDNQDAAETLKELLEIWGCQATTAYDGVSALQRVEALRPELILLDISMPLMDGYEVARRLRARPELQGVRLIALTGYGQEQDRRRAEAAGFDQHLTKPVDLDALHRVLGTG